MVSLPDTGDVWGRMVTKPVSSSGDVHRHDSWLPQHVTFSYDTGVVTVDRSTSFLE